MERGNTIGRERVGIKKEERERALYSDLREVEDDVRIPVLARHDVGPELPHEEHLVRELGRTCNMRHSAFFCTVLRKKISTTSLYNWDMF